MERGKVQEEKYGRREGRGGVNGEREGGGRKVWKKGGRDGGRVFAGDGEAGGKDGEEKCGEVKEERKE